MRFDTMDLISDGDRYACFQGELNYKIVDDDTIVFISTLHGG